MGYRKIARVLEVFAKEIELDVPHQTTIRQWVIRNGCYKLQQPIEQADHQVVLGDVTVSIGKMKCLALLSVNMRKLEKKGDLTLTHKDVEILDLHPTEASNGEFVYKALKETSARRLTKMFSVFVTDQGSDIKKGGRLLKESHPELIIIHDISHKISNVLERTLTNDPQWAEYIKHLNMTRKRCAQTELAGIMPAKQREKARFMDIGYQVNWPDLVSECKAQGNLDSISEERFHDYFGWMNSFAMPREEWKFMFGINEMIKETVRTHGLSKDIYSYLKMFFEEMPIMGDRVQLFVTQVLHEVWEESEKLAEGQTVICSTEVLESVFGKFKAINEGIQGITSNVLGMCTFVGEELNSKEIKKAMEGCTVKQGFEWVRQKVGTSLAALRRRYHAKRNGTKFDNSSECIFSIKSTP
jgi:hypothetical protein